MTQVFFQFFIVFFFFFCASFFNFFAFGTDHDKDVHVKQRTIIQAFMPCNACKDTGPAAHWTTAMDVYPVTLTWGHPTDVSANGPATR